MVRLSLHWFYVGVVLCVCLGVGVASLLEGSSDEVRSGREFSVVGVRLGMEKAEVAKALGFPFKMSGIVWSYGPFSPFTPEVRFRNGRVVQVSGLHLERGGEACLHWHSSLQSVLRALEGFTTVKLPEEGSGVESLCFRSDAIQVFVYLAVAERWVEGFSLQYDDGGCLSW